MIHLHIKNLFRNSFLIDKKIRNIERLYKLSKDERIKLTEKLFLLQIDHVFKKSDFYRTLYSKHGINCHEIRSLNDLEKLPVINRQIVKEYYKDIHTGIPILHAKASTSGTSGSPLPLFRTFDSILIEQAYLLHFRKSKGLDYSDPVVLMRGDLSHKKLFTYDKLANTLYVSSFNIKENFIKKIYQEVHSFKPKAIIGYPSSLQIFAHELRKAKLDLTIPLAFTSSETLFDNQRCFIEGYFSCKIFDWYGNAERSIALEQHDEGYYSQPPAYSVAEYSANSLITTSLHNTCFPLIRYKVDDNIEVLENDTTDPTGGSAKIRSIEGRTDDLVISKDGSRIGRLSLAIKNYVDFGLSQIVQFKPGEIHLNIVDEKNLLDDDLKANVKKSFKIYTGDGLDININAITIDQIILSKSGKYKFIQNLINKG